MFSFKLLLFLEELASVLLTPFILAYSLPRCAGEVGVFEQVLGVCGCGGVVIEVTSASGRLGDAK
jgi:hypothetical protein